MPGIADKCTQSAQGRLLWPGMTNGVSTDSISRSFTQVGGIYRLVSRQPAASASSTEQNQRVPLVIFISILAYQRLVGL
jgi:hypothetical protein